jgi:hypothetical protein
VPGQRRPIVDPEAIAVAQAILAGFQKAIRAVLAVDDLIVAEALRAMALISACNSELLAPPVRALVDWVLFADGAVGDVFGAEDHFTLFGNAGVRRRVGRLGPFLYDEKGWKVHLEDLLRREAGEDTEQDAGKSAG